MTIRLFDIINAAAGVALVFSGMALDSDSTLPLKICALCLAWFLYNGARGRL